MKFIIEFLSTRTLKFIFEQNKIVIKINKEIPIHSMD
jgi:hypothetical protein